MKKKMLATLLVLSGVLSLAACAPGSARYSPAVSHGHYDTVQVVIAEDGSFRAWFKDLKKILHERLSDKFKIGHDGLEIHLNIRSVNMGNRFDRWFWGPLVDSESQGKIAIDVEFKNPQGEVLGTATVTGKIVFGFFGGSFDSAINSAADEIYDLAVKKFGA